MKRIALVSILVIISLSYEIHAQRSIDSPTEYLILRQYQDNSKKDGKLITTYGDGTQKVIELGKITEEGLEEVEKSVTIRINELLKEGYTLVTVSETNVWGDGLSFSRTFVFKR